jgi:hypothetical protein
VRWGRKEAWSKDTGRWTRTGFEAYGVGTSEQLIAKSISIEDAGGKSGGRVSKGVELIAGDLLYVQ